MSIGGAIRLVCLPSPNLGLGLEKERKKVLAQQHAIAKNSYKMRKRKLRARAAVLSRWNKVQFRKQGN